MIEQFPIDNGRILGFKLTGKLHDEDYAKFVPTVDAAISSHGKVRLLAQFQDFYGWDLPALWDDIKFAATHLRNIERVAMVGDKKWEKWMAKVCKPFTFAKTRYFDESEMSSARTWIEEA